jgi:DNA-binding MarR family transcriptional regulator
VEQTRSASDVVDDPPGFVLPLLLLASFRRIVDDLHTELASHGHAEVRPAHGFAMQAIGRSGSSASEVGRRLGVSKQAAGKTIDGLEALGYAHRVDDPADARRKRVLLTDRGSECLALSAEIFEQIHDRLASVLGLSQARQLEHCLRTIVGDDPLRLDVAAWLLP